LEEGAAVMAAVRDLLSPYERAVILRWLDGMSFQEIAEACGTHLKSVDNALWRVKCKLRRHFLREAAEHAGQYRA
ncbi:MAG: sigma factor-like helix-turn-helix DNA-binding protein, partial [Clostridia bacterium]